MLELYKVLNPESQMTVEDFRIRNPQNDLGAIVHDIEILENIDMADDKDFYMHLLSDNKFIQYEPAI